jgi:hypothetical protein
MSDVITRVSDEVDSLPPILEKAEFEGVGEYWTKQPEYHLFKYKLFKYAYLLGMRDRILTPTECVEEIQKEFPSGD